MITVSRYASVSPALRYVDHGGEGSTLLLIHGVTRCAEDWQPLIPTLSTQWRVIALDQRGHGGSERASRYLVTDYIADAVSIVRDELTTPITIFGHSLGAMVAAAVAAELPHRVHGLVLEDPPYHTMGNRIVGSSWQTQFVGMREAARRGGSVDDITDALAEIRLPCGNGVYKRLGELRDRTSLQWSAQCLKQIDPEVLTPVIEGRWLDGYDMHAVWSHIHCPTLLLQADPKSNGALSDADADMAHATIKSCRHVRVAGCGHQLHRDRPEEVLRTFETFTTSFRLL